jgi:hypothetical protein
MPPPDFDRRLDALDAEYRLRTVDADRRLDAADFDRRDLADPVRLRVGSALSPPRTAELSMTWRVTAFAAGPSTTAALRPGLLGLAELSARSRLAPRPVGATGKLDIQSLC